MDNESLASELLHEVKMTSKRWFIAFCIMVVLEIATIAGFLWYVSLPVEEVSTEYTQSVEDVEGSMVRQIIGEE